MYGILTENLSFDKLLKLANSGDSLAMYYVGNAYFYGKDQKCDYDKAYDYYCRSAQANEPDGIYGKAVCLEYGFTPNGTRDLKSAFIGYLVASELGCIDAMYSLARCYAKSIGTGTDEQKAFLNYKKAADLGHPMAQYMTGKYYENGIAVNKDIETAVKYYEKAILNNCAKAKRRMGQILQKGIDPVVKQDNSRAFSLFLEAAEQEDGQALYEIANCYFEGICDQKKDMRKAFEYAQKAALLNNADGLYSLGTCYEYGIGGAEQNIDIAVSYYEQAANCDNVQAQVSLGFCYLKGKNGKKDKKKAYQWFRKAASKGHANAQYQLFLMYERGVGVSKDKNNAQKWLLEAKNNNHPHAIYEYARRIGESNDPQLYWNLIKQSADLGFRDAQYSIALRYREEYIHWLEVSAQSGSSVAQLELSSQYSSGVILPKDEKSSLTWLKLAAINGNPEAKRAVENKNQNEKEYRFIYDMSTKEGRKLIESKAKAGDAEAQYMYAKLLYDGYEEIQQDSEECFRYAALSADQEFPHGMYGLATCYEFSRGVEDSSNNLRMAHELYQKAMNLGNEEAALRLAYWYKNGIFVEKNEKKALTIYEDLAGKDNVSAIYSLAFLRETGSKEIRDLNVAVQLYEKASDAGNERAKEALIRIYINDIKKNGKVIRKADVARAKKLCEELEKTGNTNAKVWLVKYSKFSRYDSNKISTTGIYDINVYSKSDFSSFSKSITDMPFLKKVITCNYDERKLLILYKREVGVYTEEELASLREAADKGNIQAVNELGKSLILSRKYQEASRYFQISASKDDAEGIYYYGLCKFKIFVENVQPTQQMMVQESREIYSLFKRAKKKKYLRASFGLGICHMTHKLIRFIRPDEFDKVPIGVNTLHISDAEQRCIAYLHFTDFEKSGEADAISNVYGFLADLQSDERKERNYNCKAIDLGDEARSRIVDGV